MAQAEGGVMLISDEYRETNRYMLAHKNYGVRVYRWSSAVDGIATALNVLSVLDDGCGRGLLVANLPENRNYETFEYDPGWPGKDKLPKSADLVACTDVLE